MQTTTTTMSRNPLVIGSVGIHPVASRLWAEERMVTMMTADSSSPVRKIEIPSDHLFIFPNREMEMVSPSSPFHHAR
jgi:hypothetical protein